MTGGYDGAGYVKSAEIYDPATGKFTPAASMSVSRMFATATPLLDDRVLIAGGMDDKYDPLASAELFQP